MDIAMPISVITNLQSDPGKNTEMEAALWEMQTAVSENEHVGLDLIE